MIRAWSCFIFAAIVVTMFLGCGKPARSKMKVFPVSGKLTVAGKPVKDLVVTLSPKTPLPDSRFAPGGVVGPDGSFIIQTYEPGDGAPPGEYAVFVSAVVEMSDAASSVSDSVQRVLKKYEASGRGGTATGPKPIAEIVVKEGNNVLEPIDLQ